jgi:hypothetical protein
MSENIVLNGLVKLAIAIVFVFSFLKKQPNDDLAGSLMQGGLPRFKRALVWSRWVPIILYFMAIGSIALLGAFEPLGDYFGIVIALMIGLPALYALSHYVGPVYPLMQDLRDAQDLAYKAEIAAEESN